MGLLKVECIHYSTISTMLANGETNGIIMYQHDLNMQLMINGEHMMTRNYMIVNKSNQDYLRRLFVPILINFSK